MRAAGRARLELAGGRRLHGQGPLRRRKKGPNPTDRAKPGTKKSLIVERAGGPLGFEIEGANVHDSKLLEATIEAIVVERPEPSQLEQHLCLDKGYDNPTGHTAAAAAGYVAHIRRIGEEKLDQAGKKTQPARRWVVERSFAWATRFRRLVKDYERLPSSLAGLHWLAFLTLMLNALF